MRWLLYLRLFLLTAGTLLPFFWMVVILGHRRQRNFERIFFFLCLALTLFFGCSLLELNATLYYDVPPQGLLRFAWTFLCLGLWFLPPLIIHLHAEYANLRGLLSVIRSYRRRVILAYGPVVFLAPTLLAALKPRSVMDFEHPTRILGALYQTYLVAAMVVAAIWQYRFAKAAPDAEQKAFHRAVAMVLSCVSIVLPLMFVLAHYPGAPAAKLVSPGLFLLALFPFVLLIGNVQRFNFLQIGRQRNLIYAVIGIFLALLYLSFVRRASQWLEPYLPPAASAALLLFLPVVFFEPLQRIVRQSLRKTAQTEVDRAQKLMGPINEVARLGDLEKLRTFAEGWIAEQLQLAEAKLELGAAAPLLSQSVAAKSGAEEVFVMARSGKLLGRLRVRGFGALLSGETYAGLELICEQLPAAFDLCRLIEEKLQLERELAERERLALVGQMAASISHNLKNPLGSIKTILQVQLENPELPPNLRAETQIVLDEINRLSNKLSQLLQFSRPAAVPVESGTCEVREIVTEVLNVLRPEAERRGVRLGSRMSDGGSQLDASPEALHDIISNLVVNAMDASPPGCQVNVQVAWMGLPCVVSVEDEGAGIPGELQEKVLQPFFTTKPQGTGLGLAVVTKRVAELGGELKLISPVNAGRGTRFEVKIWPAVVRRERARPEAQTQKL